ncbi:pyridoxal-dependent decarboxylase, exosortase A system-associated [Promicromonospora thailandica]|uniref:Diaminopimelate decarboxylase n=1 Tax=Promicromonospora thailandica TaxID=765201 RepID=A0A9X2JYA6_9MICO|nr:pyridoxal-dependent decarboxylase, exosortase A system-associated [Promicromonospora thailandica]MCP2264889.1 diaminopimelate decarboxylase [Promicromonospora thailandica]BFF18844.1 pyridoxal-dependent decarboxylase, exosortase A system-associated [Promicromonospora thailandica]
MTTDAPAPPAAPQIPSHPGVPDLPVADGQLLVGGVPLRRLAERVGSTPFFAYDRRRITDRVAEVRAALGDVRLGYAVKANPMPAVVQHLSGLVDALDVASAHEMHTALDTGTDPDRISFAGPGKTPQEIRSAVAAGVLIELESETEARRVVAAGEDLGVTPRVAVRVNPDFAVRGSGMRMSGGPQQFGVDAEQVPDLLAWLGATGADVTGFHVFAGSQNLDAELIAHAQRATADLVVALAEHAPGPVRYVNLGGGLGIPYFPKDRPVDLARVGESLASVVADRLAPALPDADVHLELGRYLVGEAGYYVTRVIDRKVSRGRTYLVVDGGMHHQLAASGNLGQVIRRNYPVLLGDRMTPGGVDGGPADGAQPATVVGCLCTPLDLLADDVPLPADAEPGDLVVVLQAGAYGLTASPTAFLGHPAPAEVLV